MLEVYNFIIDTSRKNRIVLYQMDTKTESEHDLLGGALWAIISEKVKTPFERGYLERDFLYRYPFSSNDVNHLCSTGELCQECILHIIKPFLTR